MLRNKEIPDHSCHCKLRQQGQGAAEGPRCIPQAGGLPLLITVTTGEYKACASTTEHCPAAIQIELGKDGICCESPSQLVKKKNHTYFLLL